MSKDNNAHKAIDADFVSLELDRLELNEGQLDGLPANPREILETKLDFLKKGYSGIPRTDEIPYAAGLSARKRQIHHHRRKYALSGHA